MDAVKLDNLYETNNFLENKKEITKLLWEGTVRLNNTTKKYITVRYSLPCYCNNQLLIKEIHKNWMIDIMGKWQGLWFSKWHKKK